MRTLLESIKEIPERLEMICNNREDLHKKLEAYIENKEVSKIVIVASGTSYNAAFTTKHFGENILGLPIELVYPNVFYHYYNKSFLAEDVLYIFISQTGSTKLVFDSLQLVKEKGLMNIAITEDCQSPIAREASLELDMGTGIEEYVYRTIGYSASCATLYLTYLSLLRSSNRITQEGYDAYSAELSKVGENIGVIIENTLKWYTQHSSVLSKFDKFIFAGASDLFPVAMEADIKFMEMVPVFTNSFEMEELIHGPQNAFDDTTGFFLISKNGLDSEKAVKISQFINTEIGKNAILVGDVTMNDMDISLDLVSENFYALEIMAAFQVLSYEISKSRGRDLNVRINSSINNYIKKSLQ